MTCLPPNKKGSVEQPHLWAPPLCPPHHLEFANTWGSLMEAGASVAVPQRISPDAGCTSLPSLSPGSLSPRRLKEPSRCESLGNQTIGEGGGCGLLKVSKPVRTEARRAPLLDQAKRPTPASHNGPSDASGSPPDHKRWCHHQIMWHGVPQTIHTRT